MRISDWSSDVCSSDLAAASVRGLEYGRLSGGDPPGEAKPLGGDPMALAEEALAGLERMVAAFDDPNTAYRASPNPAQALRFNDYAHPPRTAEWSARGEAATVNRSPTRPHPRDTPPTRTEAPQVGKEGG